MRALRITWISIAGSKASPIPKARLVFVHPGAAARRFRSIQRAPHPAMMASHPPASERSTRLPWRLIYERYLALGSLPALQRELRGQGIVTRKRLLSSGQTIGGVPLTNGPLVHLLHNRMYRGELNHRDKSYPGEHQPIIEEDLFNQVQAKLSGNRRGSQLQRQPSEALLLGKLFDDRGNKMTPSYAIKKGFAIPIMSPASWRRAARKRQAQSPASAPMRSRTSSSASWHRFYHRWKGASDKSNPRQQPSLTRSPTGSASRHLSTGSSSVPSQSRSGWRRIGISPVDPNPSPSPGRPRPSGASAR